MRLALRGIALLGLVPTVLAAQGNSRMTGLTAGFNLSRLAGDDVSDAATDGRVGLAVGLFGSFALSEAVALQPELLFIQKGADFIAQNGAQAAVRFDYVQIPVLLRFRIATGDGNVVPFATLGPSIAFRIGCDAGITAPGGFVSQACEDVSVSDIAGTDFSLLAGGGVEIGNFILSMRYDYSFTKLNLAPGVEDVSNRGFAIMAAYGFRAW